MQVYSLYGNTVAVPTSCNISLIVNHVDTPSHVTHHYRSVALGYVHCTID